MFSFLFATTIKRKKKMIISWAVSEQGGEKEVIFLYISTRLSELRVCCQTGAASSPSLELPGHMIRASGSFAGSPGYPSPC